MQLKIVFSASIGMIAGGIFYLFADVIGIETSAVSGMLVSSCLSSYAMAKFK